ncbi:MAG: hypothetical protein JWL72_4843 [Ilumatobacteraceae bacterium]|nr:hypothetical protein [Ilumatobacteraceae bacterium]
MSMTASKNVNTDWTTPAAITSQVCRRRIVVAEHFQGARPERERDNTTHRRENTTL